MSRLKELFERNHFLLVFTPLSSMMGFGLGMSQVGTSLTALQLGATPWQMAGIAAAQNVGVLVTSIAAGLLIDQFGPIRPYLIGSTLVGFGFIASGLSASPLTLLLATIAVSLCMPFRFVAMTSTFLGQLQRMGESKAGWQRGSHMIGMFLLGPAAGAWLMMHIGIRETWWIIAGLTFATTLCGPLVFARHPAVRGTGPRLSFRAVASQLALLWREPQLRRCAFTDFLAQAIGAFFTFFIVIIAVKNLGMQPFEATHFVNAKGLSFILSLFFLGHLVSRLGTDATNRLSTLILAAALTGLGLGHGLWSLLPASFLLGLGLGLLQITNLTQQARVGARIGLGRIAGVTPLVATVGSLAGNLGGGVFGNFLGLQKVFLLLAGCAFLYFLWFLRTPPATDSVTDPAADPSLFEADSLGLD